MTENIPSVVQRMQQIVEQWEAASDARAIFLRCYSMMTNNMLIAIEQSEFKDPDWVNRLLHHFADYYFTALEAYDRDPETAPSIWRQAHMDACAPEGWPLQKLLQGVNAHINYDLVLTLVDLLRPEWEALSEHRREERYLDHCSVNDVIGRTIDAVQDEVLEPSMPAMDIIDKVFGPLDEWMISRLIRHWRETVWKYAVQLVETHDPLDQQGILRQVEEEALRRAAALRLTSMRAIWEDLL